MNRYIYSLKETLDGRYYENSTLMDSLKTVAWFLKMSEASLSNLFKNGKSETGWINLDDDRKILVTRIKKLQ